MLLHSHAFVHCFTSEIMVCAPWAHSREIRYLGLCNNVSIFMGLTGWLCHCRWCCCHNLTRCRARFHCTFTTILECAQIDMTKSCKVGISYICWILNTTFQPKKKKSWVKWWWQTEKLLPELWIFLGDFHRGRRSRRFLNLHTTWSDFEQIKQISLYLVS